MDEYVTKPLRRGDLLASIAKVLMNKLPMLTSSTAGLPPLSSASGLTVSARRCSYYTNQTGRILAFLASTVSFSFNEFLSSILFLFIFTVSVCVLKVEIRRVSRIISSNLDRISWSVVAVVKLCIESISHVQSSMSPG
jgi:hypothetical protein